MPIFCCVCGVALVESGSQARCARAAFDSHHFFHLSHTFSFSHTHERRTSRVVIWIYQVSALSTREFCRLLVFRSSTTNMRACYQLSLTKARDLRDC